MSASVLGVRTADPTIGMHARRRVKHAIAIAYVLSIGVIVAMTAASLMGLLSRHLYSGGAWAREAFRGGDVVTLGLVVPVAIVALWQAWRGSHRAEAVWMGSLAYALYDYAFYVFGTSFNDALLLHIGAFSMAIFALAFALPNLDRDAIAKELGRGGARRSVACFLVVVGVGQGALWLVLLVRNAVTGAVLNHVPVAGQHLVFALDLGLLVPSMVVAGVLLWRRTATGYVAGAAMAVMGLLYQVNAMVSGVFQANADVVGAKAFPPEGMVMTIGFLLATAAMLIPARNAR